MKILVIGGSGFIGTELTKTLLDAKHTVAILDLKKSTAYPELTRIGDIRNLNDVLTASEGCDLIINLAAEHADNVEPVSLYYDVNFNGTKNVIAAAEKNSIQKILFTSSGAVYGLDKGEVIETMIPEPFNDYGQSKLQAEHALTDWAKSDPARDLIILRPTVIFGEKNRGNVYNLFKQIEGNYFAMIGRGSNQKSLGYLKNIVAFIAFVIDDGQGVRLYNFTDKPDLSMKELVSITRSSLNKKGPLLHIPYFLGLTIGYCFDFLSFCLRKKFPISSIRIKKFCEHTTLNAKRLEATGFIPPYSLEQAIDNTIKYEFFQNYTP